MAHRRGMEWIWIAVAGALIAGCAQAPVLPPASGRPPAGGLQAWVDAPLDSTTLSWPASYPVVCHGTDASGISAVEFSVNGNGLETVANPEPSQTLFTARFAWQPSEPGSYLLRCRAHSRDGEWSAPAAAHVEVVALLAATDTPTPTPTPSATPTTTPTPTLAPAPAGLSFAAQPSSGEFHYPRDCIPEPGAVTITVAVSGSPVPTGVTLFFRFRNRSTGESGAWNEGLVLAPLGGGKFRGSVSWEAIPGIDLLRTSGDPAWFLYQFVAIGPEGAIAGRSATFSDVELTPCQ